MSNVCIAPQDLVNDLVSLFQRCTTFLGQWPQCIIVSAQKTKLWAELSRVEYKKTDIF